MDSRDQDKENLAPGKAPQSLVQRSSNRYCSPGVSIYTCLHIYIHIDKEENQTWMEGLAQSSLNLCTLCIM